MQPVKFSFAVAAAGTTFDLPIHEDGEFSFLTLKTSDYTNAVTTKLQILDKDGDVIWDMTVNSLNNTAAITALAKNTLASYQLQFPVPVHRGYTLRAVLSGVAGGTGGTVKSVLYIKNSSRV